MLELIKPHIIKLFYFYLTNLSTSLNFPDIELHPQT